MVVLIFALAPSALAQVTGVSLVNRQDAGAPLKANTTYNLILQAESASGDPVGAGKKLKISVHSGDAVLKKTGDANAATATPPTFVTDDEGQIKVTMETKSDPNVVLDFVPLADNDTPLTDFADTLDWTDSVAKFTVTQGTGPLTPRTVYPTAVSIEAKQRAKKGETADAARYQTLRVAVAEDGDARVYVDPNERKQFVDVVTDEDGKATVGLETGESTDVEILVTPLNKDQSANVVGGQSIKLNALRTFDTFHSKRLYTEVFTGVTFTNDYDADGKSTGFKKASPLVRATFDTIWYNRQSPRPDGWIRSSLLHTGIDMEVSDFPFGKNADTPTAGTPNPVTGEQEENPNTKGLATAFSGSLFAVWQPDNWFWASYTPTSTLAGFPTDALRLGVFTRVGMTTRPTASVNGDTTIGRGQLGFRFTHHQTTARSANAEQDNIVPIRFVEISYGRFEEFANQRNANRFILDAGLRLPGMGSDAIPFYAGIHLNAGRGPDDLRIFAGFLFKINELATLFQKAGVE
ncbi:MAG TPA: hypothetical protein VG323_21735 [Thermoanaerobaculia bacterium]|nr:hypothetical protein [Thermoanaerobaculia bacterium]